MITHLTIGKYLIARQLMPSKGKTTVQFVILNTSGQGLGSVGWYTPWRQYCFTASPMAVFSASCLDDIARFCKQIKNARIEWDEGPTSNVPRTVGL